MPPPERGGRRSDDQTFLEALETRWSRAALHPNPAGVRSAPDPAEYPRAVKDLSSSTSTSPRFLPPDTISRGLRNVRRRAVISPTLMEGYLRRQLISRLAVGIAAPRDLGP